MNFILRRCLPDGRVLNTAIGEHYEIVSRTIDPEKEDAHFNKIHKQRYGVVEHPHIFAFVVTHSQVHPLDRKDDNYIMTESGKTFERVSCPPAFMEPSAE